MASVLTISNQETPDPYVISAHGKFYMTFTAGNRVEIWKSDSLLTLESSCTKHMIWQPPPGQPYSGDIWAPELHALQGRWYVYVAADDPQHGNKSHRMYVLAGPPASEDPCSGEWQLVGQMRNMPNHWAIDATVVNLFGQMYMIYSGWPLQNHDGVNEDIQQLFIIRLASPTEATGAATMICKPDQPWEFSGHKGIIEGPQWLASPDSSWAGIAYSCSGSWTRDYKMATLQFVGHDPLDPNSWRKSHQPLLMSKDTPPFGPGHGTFINTEGGECMAIFHGTDRETDGWGNRKARCQRVMWTPQGPYMGTYCGPLTADLDVFRGIKQPSGHPSNHGGLKGFLQKAADRLESKIREL